MGRIADLASGWTVDSEAPSSVPARESGPTRRKAKTVPPPPPGSLERRELEANFTELIEGNALDDDRDDDHSEQDHSDDEARTKELRAEPDIQDLRARGDAPPRRPERRSSPPPVPVPGRVQRPTGGVPTAIAASRVSGPATAPLAANRVTGPVPTAKPRASGSAPKHATGPVPTAVGDARSGRAPIDLSALPEDERTKENRGAVGTKNERSGPLTTNAASGTIGGDTPPPIFDRAAIAAGARNAAKSVQAAAAGTGPTERAKGTPSPGSYTDPARMLTVPVGEFDEGATVMEQQDKLRQAYSQSTMKREGSQVELPTVVNAPAAELLRQEAAERMRDSSGDAEEHDWSSSKTKTYDRAAADDDMDGSLREVLPRRADHGHDDHDDDQAFADDARSDKTAISVPSQGPSVGRAPSGTLRAPAALPRHRGALGDLRYVFTVISGVRSANAELAEIAVKQATRQQSRRHHLVILGRTAVALPDLRPGQPRRKTPSSPGLPISASITANAGFDHPALGPAREELSKIEDQRSQHAGHVVAADAELVRVGKDREAKAKQYVADRNAVDAELASLTKKLEPLQKDVIRVKKRATDLHDSLRRLDAKIAAAEASRTTANGGKLDPAVVQAEIATLKADRKAIQADEPVIAGELDALNPRVAALEAARTEAERLRAELERAELEDQRRVEEMLTAIGAKRKVVDRAAADAEALRDKVLFALGERLYVDRPDELSAQLAPIDAIDVEHGGAERRMMELREITSSIMRWKLARGIALIVVLLAGLGALTYWLLDRYG